MQLKNVQFDDLESGSEYIVTLLDDAGFTIQFKSFVKIRKGKGTSTKAYYCLLGTETRNGHEQDMRFPTDDIKNVELIISREKKNSAD